MPLCSTLLFSDHVSCWMQGGVIQQKTWKAPCMLSVSLHYIALTLGEGRQGQPHGGWYRMQLVQPCPQPPAICCCSSGCLLRSPSVPALPLQQKLSFDACACTPIPAYWAGPSQDNTAGAQLCTSLGCKQAVEIYCCTKPHPPSTWFPAHALLQLACSSLMKTARTAVACKSSIGNDF